MPDRIEVNEDVGIIKVESYGVVSKEDIANSITKIRQILNEKGINKILVDTTKQETMPSTYGIFDLFSTFPREFRLALLTQQSQATAEDISFVETVGVNHGVQVKIFHEEEQALQWMVNE
jgi:ethanolamine utilization protein EutP (predicted NTPase)